eukprot:CAMPEP_0175882176 /NCGR_PEP_ID=MMETSP0107_2-20121207/43270_1 /TAXON_ID=195067 ORGANISM="Goniomonas pacifica, Strain CCMP1869" /NCGR_SAMPLE_ID=MMETSP0107_2 /ASSEMBLY_ACC=CAM_ASM_000203 /LENGTH=122 /DNA_ID=CAMNT_0017202087 /DNA_START=202 /DNA_END=566 /DNA_ORIENTATION=+
MGAGLRLRCTELFEALQVDGAGPDLVETPLRDRLLTLQAFVREPVVEARLAVASPLASLHTWVAEGHLVEVLGSHLVEILGTAGAAEALTMPLDLVVAVDGAGAEATGERLPTAGTCGRGRG